MAKMAISIEYNLTGRGWAECLVEIDGQRATLTASYLSDAWADLLDAVTAMVRGHDQTVTSFTEEPGEYRWYFQRVTAEKLSIRILWFDETFGRRIDPPGKTILEAECRLRTFAGAILSASQRVLAIHGMAGYQERWVNHEFPIAQQTKLKNDLDR
jgi:hypothetical protein